VVRNDCGAVINRGRRQVHDAVAGWTWPDIADSPGSKGRGPGISNPIMTERGVATYRLRRVERRCLAAGPAVWI
jgi:hypothetical protein